MYLGFRSLKTSGLCQVGRCLSVKDTEAHGTSRLGEREAKCLGFCRTGLGFLQTR